MTHQRNSRHTAIRAHLKQICSELDYANRRMFDVRTGEAFVERQPKQEPRARRPRHTTVPRIKPAA